MQGADLKLGLTDAVLTKFPHKIPGLFNAANSKPDRQRG